MVAEDVGHQLLVFGNAPLIQGLRVYRGIEGFRKGHIYSSLFKDLPSHRQSTIGRRYATIEGDHHAYLDELLRRDANIQGIADLRPDLRCGELDGGRRQGGHDTVLEI